MILKCYGIVAEMIHQHHTIRASGHSHDIARRIQFTCITIAQIHDCRAQGTILIGQQHALATENDVTSEGIALIRQMHHTRGILRSAQQQVIVSAQHIVNHQRTTATAQAPGTIGSIQRLGCTKRAILHRLTGFCTNEQVIVTCKIQLLRIRGKHQSTGRAGIDMLQQLGSGFLVRSYPGIILYHPLVRAGITQSGSRIRNQATAHQSLGTGKGIIPG